MAAPSSPDTPSAKAFRFRRLLVVGCGVVAAVVAMVLVAVVSSSETSTDEQLADAERVVADLEHELAREHDPCTLPSGRAIDWTVYPSRSRIVITEVLRTDPSFEEILGWRLAASGLPEGIVDGRSHWLEVAC